MPRCRMFFGGLARHYNRAFDDHEEKYSLIQHEELVSSQKASKKRNGAHPKAKIKRSVRRRRRIARNMCSTLPVIGPLLLRITGNERITILSLEDSLLARINQYLPLVGQVCLALTCKSIFSRYQPSAKHRSSLPPKSTKLHLPLSYVRSNHKTRVKLLTRLDNSRWA
jgi:hypothetical protein